MWIDKSAFLFAIILKKSTILIKNKKAAKTKILIK